MISNKDQGKSAGSSGSVHKIDIDVKRGRKEVGFCDVDVEYERFVCDIDMKSQSSFPSWLNGNFYKQSGAAFVGEGALLDGLAGISAFHINGKEGKAFYSNKVLDQLVAREFIRSGGQVRKWEGTASSMKESDKPGFFTSIRDSLYSFLYKFSDTNLYRAANPNVVVWRLSDPEDSHAKDPRSFYPAAATEADGQVLRFDKNTLKSNVKVSTLKPSKGQVITNAAHYYENQEFEKGAYHIVLELATNGYLPPTFTFTYAFYRGASAPFHRVMGHELVTFDWGSRAKQPVSKRASYMHSYAQTENYIILFLSSHRMQYEKLLAMDFSKGFFGLFPATDSCMELMVFKINKEKFGTPEELSYVGTYSCGSKMHSWHQANAYETNNGNTIVLDTSGTSEMSYEIDSDCFRKITLDLTSGTVSMLPLVDDDPKGAYEFPQVNPLCHFYPYRNIYVLHTKNKLESELVKVDAIERKILAKAFSEKGWSVSEPVVVPRTRNYGALSVEQEEDCVVLVAVTNTLTPEEDPNLSGQSFLSVLDPKDLSEICRIKAPHTINYGLHSHFYPDEFLAVKV